MSNTYYASNLEQLVYQHPDDANFRFYFKVRSTNLQNKLREDYQEGEIYKNVVSKLGFLQVNLVDTVGFVMANLFADEADLDALSGTASAWLSTLEGYKNDDLKDLGSVFTIDVIYYKNGNEYQFSMGDKDFPIHTYVSQSTMEFLMERELLKMDGVGKRSKSQNNDGFSQSKNTEQKLKEEKKPFTAIDYDPSLDTEEITTTSNGYTNKHVVVKKSYPNHIAYYMEQGKRTVAYKGVKVELAQKGKGEEKGKPAFYFYTRNFADDGWNTKSACKIEKEYLFSNSGKYQSIISMVGNMENGESLTFKSDYLVCLLRKTDTPFEGQSPYSVFPIGIVKGKTEEAIIPPTPDGFDDIPSATDAETKKKVSSAMFVGKSKSRA